MASFSSPSTDRREFLRWSLTSLGAVLLANAAQGQSSADNADSVHFALLSDTHLPADPANEYRGFKPYDQLQKVVPQVIKANPQGAIISGDLARLEGLPGDYANLKKLIQPMTDRIPTCMTLGNHDHRGNFNAEFPSTLGEKQKVNNKHTVVIDTPVVRFIVLDSLLYVNQTAGLLGKNQREWLERFLQDNDKKPTLIVFHHTPGDGDGDLLDIERLFAIVSPQSQVKALLFGHSHVYSFAERDGIHLINLPAIGYNFRDDEPVGWVDARLNSEGGDFTLRAVDGNTENDGKVTSLQWRT